MSSPNQVLPSSSQNGNKTTAKRKQDGHRRSIVAKNSKAFEEMGLHKKRIDEKEMDALKNKIESLYDELIAKEQFQAEFHKEKKAWYEQMLSEHGYKVPFLNLLYDAFLDEVPNEEELKSSLETIGILSALMMR